MNKYEIKYFNTSKKMNDALILLLLKKDFDYITIKDICQEAKVNRSTFYLHYENTYDLLEEVISNLNKSFKESFKDVKPIDISISNIAELNFIDDKYLVPYLNFIKENKQVYKALRNEPKIFKADKTYEKMFEKLFSPILDKFNVKDYQKRYVIDFFISGITSIVYSWCQDDCKVDVSDIASLIKQLINHK